MSDIQKHLFELQDEGYRRFTLPLIPNIDEKTFIGVRLPAIKKYGKSLTQEERAKFLRSLPHVYHEENILHAFLLCDIKDFDDFIAKVDSFLPYITNWSVCDTICNKHLNKYKKELLPIVYDWLKSEEVYRVRYAVKCLMNYYLGEDFDAEHIAHVEEIQLDDYYVKMMVAWYLATGLAKNYDSFVKAIEDKRFCVFTHNKAIQKAVESFRVSEEHKAYLKTLKIK